MLETTFICVCPDSHYAPVSHACCTLVWGQGECTTVLQHCVFILPNFKLSLSEMTRAFAVCAIHLCSNLVLIPTSCPAVGLCTYCNHPSSCTKASKCSSACTGSSAPAQAVQQRVQLVHHPGSGQQLVAGGVEADAALQAEHACGPSRIRLRAAGPGAASCKHGMQLHLMVCLSRGLAAQVEDVACKHAPQHSLPLLPLQAG